ncbi:MAG TPA: prephenate dehydratase, partial [Terriglobia bacterium]|nr:prephenate dehydratase [Terriglobia bacterium]
CGCLRAQKGFALTAHARYLACMKIAIQGELGAFSHEAALRMVPRCAVVPCARSAEVFDRVQKGSVAGAVIPIENSLAGSVAEHFDLLLSRNVFIQSEFPLRIVHNLISAPGVKLGDVRQVFSHPVALDQCRDFFRRNPKIEPVAFYDTAGSVKHVVEKGLKNAAGIAGREAARVYSARILKSGIEDNKQNFTRFFYIRKKKQVRPGANKTSLAFSVKNIPGALFKALSVFALRDISLSKIESRPVRGRPWEYVFYVDILRGDDAAARNALRHLGEVADLVKVLGVYPAA